MAELLFSKIAQAVLMIVAFLAYVLAEIQDSIPSSISPFEEAAKYGFAVLVLFIVLALLYRDWKQEKEYSRTEIKDLNGVLREMADMNRQALERSSKATEKQNETNERLADVIRELKSDINRQ